jgi:hypothetical protein
MKKSGLEKEARDLEHKLLNYKRANTLYQTSQETGEDLVDQAHPKGSYHMPGLGELGIIETVIDQQLKSLKMVEKKPTGKLANREIIDAVKVILAEENKTLEEVKKELGSLVASIKERIEKVGNIASQYTTEHLSSQIEKAPLMLAGPLGLGALWLDEPTKKISNFVSIIRNNLSVYNANNFKKAKNVYHNFYDFLKPGFQKGISEDGWSIVEPIMNPIGSDLTKAIELVNKINLLESKEAPEEKKPENEEKVKVFTNQQKKHNIWIEFLGEYSKMLSKMDKIHKELGDTPEVKNTKLWIKQKIEKMQMKASACLENIKNNEITEDQFQDQIHEFEKFLNHIDTELKKLPVYSKVNSNLLQQIKNWF